MTLHTPILHTFSRSMRRPLALAVALALVAPIATHAAALPVNALPTLPHNLSGSISIPAMPTVTMSNGIATSTLSITQQSKGAIVDWDSFNIGKNAAVEFLNPTFGKQSVTLNRVTGTSPSQIFGQLHADGTVFLINPQGITFAAGSSVSVGGLVASTLDISNNDFNKGVANNHFVFNGTPPGNDAAISNAGNIAASSGGTIALLGADAVTNSGTITAPRGTVALGTGKAVVLDIGGDGLTQLVATGVSGQHGVTNTKTGILQADGGQVVLHADVVVNQEGIVRARYMQNRGGIIVLDSDGAVNLTGSVELGGPHPLAKYAALDGLDDVNANGNLTISSEKNVFVASQAYINTLDASSLDANSYLADSTLANALNNNTNVTVNATGNTPYHSAYLHGSVSFVAGDAANNIPAAQITKSSGDDAQITFNANRNIMFGNGTGITSSSGKLDINLNADSNSRAYVYNSYVEEGGTIELNDGARFSSNGGSIRLYGQSDPSGGAASGYYFSYTPIKIKIASAPAALSPYVANGEPGVNGIWLKNATLDASCTTCSSGGDISLYGQGIQIQYVDTSTHTGIGISAVGTTLRSGGGNIFITSLLGNPVDTHYSARGSDIYLNGTLDVSATGLAGSQDGGRIYEGSAGVSTFDTTTMTANAAANGNGGGIYLSSTQGLYTYRTTLSAAGGTTGGDGGTIETSGGGLDLDGLTVNTASPGGAAGTWLIGPENGATIVHGSAPGTLPTNPLPFSGTTIQDSNINDALNGGSNVTISGTYAPSENIVFDDVDIERSMGTAPLTFRIDANANIETDRNGGGTIASTGGAGPLNIFFDANFNHRDYTGDNYSGYIDLTAMTLLSNGGDVLFYGQGDPDNGYASASQLGVHFDDGRIDTRIGQNDANAGGDVIMRGLASDSVLAETGIDISGSSIATSTGGITLRGVVQTGGDAGVGLSGMLVGRTVVRTKLSTTSGNITLDGTSLLTNDAAPKWGVRIGGINATGINGYTVNDLGGVDISSDSGNISIIGRAEGDPTLGLVNPGVQLGTDVNITNGSGRILIAGEATTGTAAGVEIDNGTVIDSGSGNVVIQARNNGTGDALALNGTLASMGTIDLRPGGVDVNGDVTENPNDAIALGTGFGFAISAAELDNITAGNLVLGSDIQAGAITVSAPVSYAGNLTLDSGAGSIAVNGALNVGANTLALISAGNITQAAPITAASLLAQSSAGSVNLTNTGNNISSATLAGSASGDFAFVNAGTVGIGDVSATGFAAAGNTATTLAGTGISSGGNLLVRALAGDMMLNADVSGSNVDLVSNGVFDNAGGNTINATGHWQVWGNTWLGETRGGVAGNGNLPNLYGCVYGGTCGVTPSGTANQFIYMAQPTATVNFSSYMREYGLPNAALNYTIGGMILGDQAANAITGTASTDATQASHVGNYAIGGVFMSPAGYLVRIVPGTLAITPATLTYFADPYSRIYGDPNGVLGGSVSGFRLNDTQANSTTGTLAFTTGATQGSNVGRYAISGGGLDASDYVFVQAAGNANALAITPATLTYVADPYSRIYGDPNGALGGNVDGFRNGDTLVSATTGTLAFTTNATQGSNVGRYAIDGGGLSAGNYVFAQAAGNASALTITPATLTYVADPVRRLVGTPNDTFIGDVTGLRNGDTLANATTGTLVFSSPTDTNSPVGVYGIFGSGLTLNTSNYVFMQANGNATALTITPPPQTYTLDVLRDTPVTYVYDRNFGIVGLCPATDLASGARDKDGDTLAHEWSRVRSRPNLPNCVSTKQKNSCGDF